MISTSGSTVASYKVMLGNFTKALEAALMVQLHAATAEWVKAVLKKIPVYTGTARGTFAPLSRVLTRFKVSNPSVGPVNAKAAEKIKRGFVYPKGGRRWALGFNAGMQHATHSFDMTIGPGSRTLSFTFVNDLPYVLWNDMYPAPAWMTLPSNPPWEAYRAGAQAFEKYCLNEIGKNIPGIAGLITVQLTRIR